MTTPSQNFDHVLNITSGSDGMHDLQFKAAPASGQEWHRGAVVTLNAAGALIAGKTTEHDMPMFAINATYDLDVVFGQTSTADRGNMTGGKVACFPATGGYEIFTTEFVAGTYAPNDLLTPAGGGNAGKVTLAEDNYSDALVCGVVSKGTATGIYDQSILHFWPVYIPAVNTAAASV